MAPGTKPGILVIGFDANFCYLMERYGRISANNLAFANHDEDILAQVRKNQPGVIFLEVAHHVGYVRSVFHEIKTNQDTCEIPIIICSWQDKELDGEEEKADFHLRLPILYEHFTTALDHVRGLSAEK